uniref:Transcriptional regulator n=1 Tax=Strongyloides venezuelensis TaxID=75913 RepID=A0A0K0EYI3_STRVS
MTVSNIQKINEKFEVEDAALEVAEVLRSYPSDYIHIRELFLEVMPKYNLKKIDKKYNIDKVTVNKLVSELIKNDVIMVKSYDKNGVPDIVRIKRNDKCYSQVQPESIKITEKDFSHLSSEKNIHIYEEPKSFKNHSHNHLEDREKHNPEVVFEERKYYFITNDNNKEYHHSRTFKSNNRRGLYINDKAKPVGYVDPVNRNHRRICILNDKYKPYHLKRYPSTREAFVGEVIDMLTENGEMSVPEIIKYFWRTYYINLDLNYINKLFRSGYNDIGYALYNIISDITIRKDNDSREMYLKYTPKYMREFILI